jgi:hypothetical protein
LVHTTVPPRETRTDEGTKPASVIETGVPDGGGGGDAVLDVEEVELDVVDDDVEDVEDVVDVLAVEVVELELVVLAEIEADAVDDGLGAAHAGGIDAGAGCTGCQFGSTSIAAFGAG